MGEKDQTHQQNWQTLIASAMSARSLMENNVRVINILLKCAAHISRSPEAMAFAKHEHPFFTLIYITFALLLCVVPFSTDSFRHCNSKLHKILFVFLSRTELKTIHHKN